MNNKKRLLTCITAVVMALIMLLTVCPAGFFQVLDMIGSLPFVESLRNPSAEKNDVSNQLPGIEYNSNGTLLGSADGDIDFEAIIESSKDEAYRSIVETKDDSIIIVRTETEGSVSIDEENWYQSEGFVGYEAISETVDQETGVKRVTYRLQTSGDDIWALTDKVNDSDAVLVAEPDYVFHICDVPSADTNPGMDSQWYLEDQNMITIWTDNATYGNATGEGVVVAVIDTGVDYGHEDLKDNMWINTAELLGEEGVDDDNNGYVDDIYGVSFVDGSANPMDDNGHGTHVAGIIAMANNNVGGVGIAYKAQIMAIKAGQSDGTFSSSDIAKAIEYAYKNGADVINMSFGSYAHSAIIEAALQDAFSSCVLVAAAGNDTYPTLDSPFCPSGNMYPAAYSYVIGVMASDETGNLASFSNWDYKTNYGAEYEIVAPGVNMYSTLPGDRYASWSGTSMAAPVVSAIAAIIRSANPDKTVYSSRYIMGQIASATEDLVTFSPVYADYLTFTYKKLNLADSLLKSPTPNIFVDEVYIFDSTDISEMNNGDGIIQPGETVDIAVGLRNQWGAATNVDVVVHSTSVGGVENPYITYPAGNTVRLDDIGTFAKQNNGFVYNESNTVIAVSNPIRVVISEDAPNDVHLAFYINYTANNALDANDTNVYTQLCDTVFTCTVQRGTVLKGKISSDMTLTADNYYIIENSLLIPRGVTVNVEPGTQIQFWSTDSSSMYGDTNIAFIQVEGTMNFNGTEENPIYLFPGNDFEFYPVQVEKADNGIINMSYVDIINPKISITTGDHLSIIQDYDYLVYRELDSNGAIQDYETCARVSAQKISYSKISSLRGRSLWSRAEVRGSFDTVLFDNCQINFDGISAVNCTFLGNQGRVEDSWSGTLQYFSSLMNNVGDKYMTPQYETVSSVINLDGKKYVLYKFDNYFYTESWDENGNWINPSYQNFVTLLQAIRANGGDIASIYDHDKFKELASILYHGLDLEEDSSFPDVISGVYYNREAGSVVADSDTPEWLCNNLSYQYPLLHWRVYLSENGIYDESINDWVYYTELNVTTWSSDWMPEYVLAEYPESVADYNVENPVFDPEVLGILLSTKFTNNAILNRLTSKDTEDWMKVRAEQNNHLIYAIAGNFWGTTDATLLQKQIIDFDTNIRYGDYIAEPYLLAPDAKTYPCVSDIYILDKDGNKVKSVGNGTIEVHVIFNRAMDTTVDPMVTYGPDDPYTDYTFEGNWVSDIEWVGTATVKILINQGQQFLRVKDAVAADDSWLTTGTDWARFDFYIEASGAEALTLQGEGVKGGVYLNWVQDEYDTLAGYNVYRSDSGDEGTFKKVNSSIIAGSSKEFTDTSVKCGKKYYYYFTVVDTDLTESRPSNIISCASIDDEAPTIRPATLQSITLGVNATLVATISDNVAVNSASVFYRMQGERAYTELQMTRTNNTTYSVQIPAKALSLGTLEYYFRAADSLNVAYSGSEAEPLTCPVESKILITSIISAGGNVGSNITAVINGLNFTPNVEVYIENQKVDAEFVSSEKINITGYVADSLGMKRVSIYVDGNLAAYHANAIAVYDDSIYLKDSPTTIIMERSEWQCINFVTNYTGKVSSIEITYRHYFPDANFGMTLYPRGGWNSETCEYDGDYTTRKFKCNFTVNAGDVLIYWDIYNLQSELVPEIVSIKINGIEIQNLTGEEGSFTFIDEAMYVPVEEIIITDYPSEITVGDSFFIEYTVYPQNATLRDNVSFSFNDCLRRNEDGSFTAIASGGSYIDIHIDNVSAQTPWLNVQGLPITALIPEKASYVGTAGSRITINITAEPVESDVGIDSWINWSDNGSANILENRNNGRQLVVELLEPGKVTLTVRYNELECVIPIEILENKIYVDITEEIMTLYPNETASVTSQLMNVTESDDVTIHWSSSDTSVATVNADGTITAVGVGYALITTSVDGGAKTDSVVVLVGTDSMSYTRGDLNMDGKITSTDAMLALKLALLSNCSDFIVKIADVNGDNIITASDALRILQYVTGAITSF